jgi:general stress protein 26
MSVQEVDDSGNIWFISSADSNKNFEIKLDNSVQLFFADTSDSHYLSVYGHATIYKDKATIEEVWSTVAEAWFEKGKDDPNVSVIKVKPTDAYYWDTKNGKAVQLLKIAASTITGKGNDDGVEGSLDIT